MTNNSQHITPASDDRIRELSGMAIEVRRKRAAIKNALKSGAITMERALNDPDAGRIKVIDLLKSLPGIGRKKAPAIMRELGISNIRRVEGLYPGQRDKLVEYAREVGR